MYSEGKFQTMLQTVLVENTLKEDEKVADKPALKLNLSLVEDHFNQIQEKLAGSNEMWWYFCKEFIANWFLAGSKKEKKERLSQFVT